MKSIFVYTRYQPHGLSQAIIPNLPYPCGLLQALQHR